MAGRGNENLRPSTRGLREVIRPGGRHKIVLGRDGETERIAGAATRFESFVREFDRNTPLTVKKVAETIIAGKKVRSGGDNHHRFSQH